MSMAMEELKKELRQISQDYKDDDQGVLDADYISELLLKVFIKWCAKPRCKEKECGEVLWGIEVSIGYCSTCQSVADHRDD